MKRSQPNTFLASAEGNGGAAHDERPSCLACGARILSGEPTIKIRGDLVHIRCAVYRRRAARR
jgi:hypothetical protein